MSAAVSPAIPPQSPERKSPWLVNPAVDLIIGCGAWTLPFLLLTSYLQDSAIIPISLIFYTLALFCNNPHYMATIYRAYGTAEDFSKYKVFTVYLTVFLLLTAALTLYAPTLLPWLFTIYLTWSPWHYTGQNFGIAMMFSRRSGATPSRAVRNALYGACVSSYVAWFFSIHSQLTDNPYIVTLGIPSDVARVVAIGCLIFFCSACIYVMHQLGKQLDGARLLPVAMLILTQFSWFLLPLFLESFFDNTATPIYFSTGALAFMHCAQYLWITSYYANRESISGVRKRKWRPVAYFTAMMLGGIALFIPGPWIVSYIFHYNYFDCYWILVALINIHHFMLDGAIWKLRDGRIASLLLGKGNKHADAKFAESGFMRAVEWFASPSLVPRAIRWGGGIALVALALIDVRQYSFFMPGNSTSPTSIFSLNKNDGRAYIQQAEQLAREGDVDGALEVVKRGEKLRGYNVQGQRLQASLLLAKGDKEAAWKAYGDLQRETSSDLATLTNVGVLAAERGEFDKALTNLVAAHRMAPDRADIVLNIAELYFSTGKYEKAIEYYSLYEPPADNAELTLAVKANVAESLYQTNNFEDALAFFQDVAQSASETQNRDLRARMLGRIADIMATGTDATASLQASREAIRAAEDTANPLMTNIQLYNYALVLLKNKMPDRAMAVLLHVKNKEGPSKTRESVDTLIDQIEAKSPGTKAKVEPALDSLFLDAITFAPA